MLDYAYAQYMITTIVKENQVLDTIEIEKAKENKYDVISIKDINILHKKNEKVSTDYKVYI